MGPTKADSASVRLKLLETMTLEKTHDIIDSETENDYLDIQWYGNDFEHPSYGLGCYVLTVTLDDDPDGNYATLKFNTKGGDWHDLWDASSVRTWGCLDALCARAKQKCGIV